MQAKEVPGRDTKALKQLFKFYETKEYKKGIKHADKMLETNPDQPETKCIKGLFLFLTGQPDEGTKLAKEGLMKNLKSEICWHILGILNRNNRNYAEAVKCYTQALKIDPENMNILRDMAVLQLHIRDVDGHLETRRKLLIAKSGLPLNWAGFAIAQHMVGNYDEALSVLNDLKRIEQDAPLKPHERGEIYVYEAMIMMESKKYRELVNFLIENEKFIVDKSFYHEYRAEGYIQIGQNQKAQEHIKELLNINCEDHNYIDLYQRSHGINIGAGAIGVDNSHIVKFYDDLEAEYPRSTSIKRNRLLYVRGEEFKKRFDEFIRPYFIKGLPSIFSEIKQLFEDEEKVKIMENVLLDHKTSLEANNTFHGSNTIESPCCLLWCYYLLAQLYDKIERFDDAITYVDKAVLHTPTFIELYLTKAKIFKHNHNYKLAAELADKARSLDLADRYLNNKAVKYLLFANEIEKADNLLKTFIRNNDDGNIHELQYMWYEYQLGNAYLRMKKYGQAFRQFKFIEKHIGDMYEDQFDFHTFCLRKYELRSYIQLIRQENHVYNNKHYIKTTIAMINGLLEYQNEYLPEKLKQEEEEKRQLEAMNARDRKKHKKEKESKEQTEDSSMREKLDLDGKQYLSTLKNPLEEAANFAKKLMNEDIKDVDLRVQAFTTIANLYLLRGKVLLAIKAYNKIGDLARTHGDVHQLKIKIYQAARRFYDEVKNEEVKKVIAHELSEINGALNDKEIIMEFKNESQDNLFNKLKSIETEANTELLTFNQAADEIYKAFDKHSKPLFNVITYALNVLSTKFKNHEIHQKLIEKYEGLFKLSPLFNKDALNIKPLLEVQITSLK